MTSPLENREREKQPSHQAIMVAVAKVQTSVEFIAARQTEHIRESQDFRKDVSEQLSTLKSRTAVLESHEDAPKSARPHWAVLAAAGVAVFGGLASAAGMLENILVAVWEAVKGGAT